MAANTEPAFSREEMGAALPIAQPVDIMGQPRGDGRFPVGHVNQFSGIGGSSASRSYYQLHDEALAHSRANADLMRLDPVIDACLRSLTYPISMLTNSIQPDDQEDPAQVAAAARAEKNLQKIPGLLFAKQWLLNDGVFTGRSAVKVRWQNVQKRDRLWQLPTGFENVSGDKLVFKYSGQVGILVQASFPAPTESVTGGGGRAYFLSPEDREQLLLFQFEPADTSFYNPMRSGAIMGTGLRDKLYWLWALKMRIWGMGMDFLQWFARGLTVYYFRNGNAEHATAIKNWVDAQDGSSAMLFPYFVGNEKEFKPIERFEASTASPAFLQQLITDYFDRLMKEIILGQSLTSGTAATGLGSGVASAHQATFDNRIKYIATAFDEIMSRDLLGPYYRANEPGITPGHWVSDLDNPNAQSMLENAQTIVEMGGAVPEEPLLEAAGLPEVKTGQTLLTNVQPMQPAATGIAPDNTPTNSPPPVQLSRKQWERVEKLAYQGHVGATKLLLGAMFRGRR